MYFITILFDIQCNDFVSRAPSRYYNFSFVILRQIDRQTDRQNRLFDQKKYIYKLHTIIVQIDDQETATKTKFVPIVTATF